MPDSTPTATPPGVDLPLTPEGRPPWLEANTTVTKSWTLQLGDAEVAMAVNLEVRNTLINAGELDRALDFLGLSLDRRLEFIRGVVVELE